MSDDIFVPMKLRLILNEVCVVFASQSDEFHSIDNESFANSRDLFAFDLPIAFVVHGLNTRMEEWAIDLASAWSQSESINVCCVDWSKWANCDFALKNKYYILSVAKFIAKFIKNLNEKCLFKWSDIRLLGHSMGAHIIGNVGKILGRKKIAICYGEAFSVNKAFF